MMIIRSILINHMVIVVLFRGLSGIISFSHNLPSSSYIILELSFLSSAALNPMDEKKLDIMARTSHLTSFPVLCFTCHFRQLCKLPQGSPGHRSKPHGKQLPKSFYISCGGYLNRFTVAICIEKQFIPLLMSQGSKGCQNIRCFL